jgi:hypothetical protein
MIRRIQQILNRRMAYRRCFMDGDGKITRDGEIVLADLIRFCRWYQSTTVVSPVSRQTDVPASFQAAGRREVFARLMANLHVSDADLNRMTDEREAINE